MYFVILTLTNLIVVIFLCEKVRIIFMDRADEIILKKWFGVRNISSGTQKIYRMAIKDYSEFIGKSPSELIAEADEEEENGVRPIKTKVFGYLISYKEKLRNADKKAPGTVNVYFSAAKSFYKAHGITLHVGL